MKKMTVLAAVFFLLSFIFVVLFWNKIAERLKLEADKSVEIALDLTGEKNKGIDNRGFRFSSSALKAAGLTAFCSLADAAFIKDCEKILFVKTGENVDVKNEFRYSFENNIIPGWVGSPVICTNELILPKGFLGFPRENIVTLHILKRGEENKLSKEDILKRFRRAAVERNIKILVAPDFETALKIKESLSALKYEQRCFSRNPVKMSPVPNEVQIFFKKIHALLISIVFPLFGFFLMRLFKSTSARFLILTFVSLLASFIIAGLLSETDFMLKLNMFSGAKLAVLLPPLAVFFILAYENKALFDKKAASILSAIVLSFIVVVVIARSGNYSMPLLPFEKELREWFENVFVARPRLKEFLTGHPAMLSGLYVYVRAKVPLEKIAAIFLISLGMLGQTSIINTFCHPQADFILSVLRTMYGLLIGVAIGGLLILFLKLAKKY
ncbi:MAG: DUF5693 family protein [Candidatus Firestonebacteria bacterium]